MLCKRCMGGKLCLSALQYFGACYQSKRIMCIGFSVVEDGHLPQPLYLSESLRAELRLLASSLQNQAETAIEFTSFELEWLRSNCITLPFRNVGQNTYDYVVLQIGPRCKDPFLPEI